MSSSWPSNISESNSVMLLLEAAETPIACGSPIFENVGGVRKFVPWGMLEPKVGVGWNRQ